MVSIKLVVAGMCKHVQALVLSISSILYIDRLNLAIKAILRWPRMINDIALNKRAEHNSSTYTISYALLSSSFFLLQQPNCTAAFQTDSSFYIHIHICACSLSTKAPPSHETGTASSYFLTATLPTNRKPSPPLLNTHRSSFKRLTAWDDCATSFINAHLCVVVRRAL
jgi:hypothetical protein